MKENEAGSLTKEETGETTKKPRVLLIIFTVILASIDIFYCFFISYLESGGDGNYIFGYVLGLFLLPTIIVAIFQIWKRFRNPRSIWRIIFRVFLIIFVCNITSFNNILLKL